MFLPKANLETLNLKFLTQKIGILRDIWMFQKLEGENNF